MGNTENRTAVETEPFPYRLYGFDADNGIDGSVILRSRLGYYLNILDGGR